MVWARWPPPRRRRARIRRRRSTGLHLPRSRPHLAWNGPCDGNQRGLPLRSGMLMTESNSQAHDAAILSDGERGLRSPHVPPFHAIYKQYFDFVWASARHLGAATDAVDDVVQ